MRLPRPLSPRELPPNWKAWVRGRRRAPGCSAMRSRRVSRSSGQDDPSAVSGSAGLSAKRATGSGRALSCACRRRVAGGRPLRGARTGFCRSREPGFRQPVRTNGTRGGQSDRRPCYRGATVFRRRPNRPAFGRGQAGHHCRLQDGSRAAKRADDISKAYVAQLAIYRQILRPLYPGREIECRLIFTTSGAGFALPPSVLDATLAELGLSGACAV